jgi:hypothetical protein
VCDWKEERESDRQPADVIKKTHFENLLIDEFVEGRKWSGGQL